MVSFFLNICCFQFDIYFHEQFNKLNKFLSYNSQNKGETICQNIPDQTI